MTDLEVYVKDISVSALVKFLEVELDSDAVMLDSYDLVEIYSFGDIRATLTGGVEGKYASLYLVGASIWKSDLDFAHYVSKKLNALVRCDPGSNYSELDSFADIMVEVCDGKESIVNLF